jgi:hypothetical protein
MGYELDVPIADVPAELVETGSDLFQPKSHEYVESFSEDELRDLAHLYGLICEAARLQVASVTDLQKQPEWRRVIAVAKELAARLAVP